jgi:heat shock protein HslJ
MMKRILLGLMLVFVFQACSEKMTANKIKNSKWVLTEWPGKTLPTAKQATLNFDAENNISGKSFCNGFGGNAAIEGNTVKLDQIMGTMMYCEDVGQAEKLYLDDLKATTSFNVVEDKLRLFKDSQLLMVFTKTN